MAETQHMTCMEVWGGIDAVDTAVGLPGLDCWVYSKPYAASTSGGDLHYVSSCATGRITRLLLADVAGHGATVSETASRLRTLMRRYVNYLDQARLVTEINRQFATMADVGSFATAIVATFFGPTGFLTLSNAGHPPPLVYRVADRQWSIITPDRSEGVAGLSNIPFGIDDAVSYDETGVKLAVGDMVLCYTDSLVEARGGDGEFLTPAGLLDVVRTVPTDDPTAFIPRLLEAVARLHPKNLADDDVTTLLLRPNGKRTRVPFHESLWANVRFLTMLVRPGPTPWPDLKLANVGGAIFAPLNRLWGRDRGAERQDATSPSRQGSKRQGEKAGEEG